MTVEITILAMIAVFLGLRLYAVLGRRAEHGEEPIHRLEPPRAAPDMPPGPRPVERMLATRPRELPGLPPSVERGLRDIAAADRRFDPVAFIEGARAAYRMILEAFWRGDRDELAGLCERSVANRFAEAIAARNAAGEVLENRLVRINETSIVAADYTAPIARVSVRFVADVAAVTRDAAGAVIAGSLDDAVEVRDRWTFMRNITAAGPDWLLEETDEG